MSILIDKDTKVVVQGITGFQGKFHAEQMQAYGTQVVAGVTPGKGGETVNDVPVYDTIAEAKSKHEINAAICFVPGKFAQGAFAEALEHNLDPLVMITEHIPVHITMQMVKLAQHKNLHIIGPNTPGLISPGACKMGIMPSHVFQKGNIGLISRSGTLTYEIAAGITSAGLGQSTCVGMGGDPITGMNYIDLLALFEKDEQTEAIVLIGEIGGRNEEDAAEYIKQSISKPVVAYIAGRTAPPGKRMGHAGAIISSGMGTAESKMKALTEAQAKVAEFPHQVAEILQTIL